MNDWYLQMLEERYDYLEAEYERQFDEFEEEETEEEIEVLPAA